MYKLLVILQVADFRALDEFEQQASVIMSGHKGRITAAFETARREDGSGEEVHIVEFDSQEDFDRYRSDPGLQALQGLRDKAISATEIKICGNEKFYS